MAYVRSSLEDIRKRNAEAYIDKEAMKNVDEKLINLFAKAKRRQ